MTGAPEPLYVAAREVLLDGLTALGPHVDAVVLVGAQAIYLHTGEVDLAVAPYTTDADLAISPQSLAPEPLLADLLVSAGFDRGSQPGIWIATREVEGRVVQVGFDLLVPDTLGGSGRRGARLPHEHGKDVARKARGLEAALIDNQLMRIASLANEKRSTTVRVAGSAALIVAKAHKLGEREQTPERLRPKDAYDILRLLRAVSVNALASGFAALRDDAQSQLVTNEAIGFMRRLFSVHSAIGPELAARAAAGLEDEDEIRQSCALLTSELLSRLDEQTPPKARVSPEDEDA
jgi:hypothetical protein